MKDSAFANFFWVLVCITSSLCCVYELWLQLFTFFFPTNYYAAHKIAIRFLCSCIIITHSMMLPLPYDSFLAFFKVGVLFFKVDIQKVFSIWSHSKVPFCHFWKIATMAHLTHAWKVRVLWLLGWRMKGPKRFLWHMTYGNDFQLFLEVPQVNFGSW